MTDYLSIDRNTPGNRCDLTPLFANPEAFSRLLDDLMARLTGLEFDRVAAIDALGFILGTGLALRARKGLIVIRKGGKLPVPADAADFIDYTGQRKSLELGFNAVFPGSRLLLVDEWIETGAQVLAAIGLIERRGGIIAGVAAINIDMRAHADLPRSGYRCFAVSQT